MRRADTFVSFIAVHKELLASAWDGIIAIIPPQRLCAWTVNERDELLGWVSRGVGYITSDDPVLALAIRGTSEAA